MTYEKAQNEKGKFSAAWVKTLGNKIANYDKKKAQDNKETWLHTSRQQPCKEPQSLATEYKPLAGIIPIIIEIPKSTL